MTAVFVVAIDVYVLFVSEAFFPLFGALLVALGAPLAAWAGVFVTDLFLVRRTTGYNRDSLVERGRLYGDFGLPALIALVLGAFVGLGFVSATAPGFGWLGYLSSAGSQLTRAGVGVWYALVTASAIYAALLQLWRRSGRRAA